jgi:type IV secretion system protein VirB10
MRRLIFFFFAATLVAAAQSNSDQNTAAQTAATQTVDSQSQSATKGSLKEIIVPAGTEVPLILKSAIDTKNTRSGDGVYCQTVFPVVIDNVVAIPAGTYVKGEVVKAQRAGKIKGRAEVQLKFDTLIFPNGYTVNIPGTIHHDSGSSSASVDDEGKIKADPQKGKDATTVAKGTGIGAAGGAIITGTRAGVLSGAGIGGLAGLATVLMTRGQDVRIEPGASIKMLLQRPLTVDVVPFDSNRAATDVVPRASTNNRLPTATAPATPK